ncbi:MAG: hypothetical protein HY237_11550 [Acidobacteria bacterium]|nr:hypothetical protein [Acidobacteriota bacterium]
MENLTGLGAMATVMALSISLALGLVWLCLAGTFRLLPARTDRIPPRLAATSRIAARRAKPSWVSAQSAVVAKGLPGAAQAGLDR